MKTKKQPLTLVELADLRDAVAAKIVELDTTLAKLVEERTALQAEIANAGETGLQDDHGANSDLSQKLMRRRTLNEKIDMVFPDCRALREQELAEVEEELSEATRRLIAETKAKGRQRRDLEQVDLVGSLVRIMRDPHEAMQKATEIMLRSKATRWIDCFDFRHADDSEATFARQILAAAQTLEAGKAW